MNIELALKAISIDCDLYDNFPETLKNNISFMQQALEIVPFIMQRANESIKNNQYIVRSLVKSAYHIHWFRHVSEEIKNNKEFMIELLSYNSDLFAYAGVNIRNDKSIIIEIFHKDTYCLDYVDESLLYDKNFVDLLVSVNSFAIYHLPDAMKLDRNMIINNIKTIGPYRIPKQMIQDDDIMSIDLEDWIIYAPLKRFGDPNVISYFTTSEILKHIPQNLKTNKDFIKEIEQLYSAIKLSKTILRNKPLLNAILLEHPYLHAAAGITSMNGLEFHRKYPKYKYIMSSFGEHGDKKQYNSPADISTEGVEIHINYQIYII